MTRICMDLLANEKGAGKLIGGCRMIPGVSGSNVIAKLKLEESNICSFVHSQFSL